MTSVLVLPQRQTALVAKQAAELDLLSGGRVAGVGVGRNFMEYEALDQDFTTRGRRLEEQVEVLRRLWTEGDATYEGRWHHLDRMGLNPGRRATTDPHLDGIVPRCRRGQGAPAHGAVRPRLAPAVPAGTTSSPRSPNASGATCPTPGATDPRWAWTARSRSRRTTTPTHGCRRAVRGAWRHPRACDDRWRRLPDAAGAPRRRASVAGGRLGSLSCSGLAGGVRRVRVHPAVVVLCSLGPGVPSVA